MDWFKDKLKNGKGKSDPLLDQGSEASGTASNASGTSSLVTAMGPAVGTSIAALGLKQVEGHIIASSQSSSVALVPNKPADGSDTEVVIRQGTITESSAFIPDTTSQSPQESEDKQNSGQFSVSTPRSEETKLVSRPPGERFRDGAIIALDFASIISEAIDLLRPVKAVAGGIKRVLEIAKV
jgi:hypothetical protein